MEGDKKVRLLQSESHIFIVLAVPQNTPTFNSISSLLHPLLHNFYAYKIKEYADIVLVI